MYFIHVYFIHFILIHQEKEQEKVQTHVGKAESFCDCVVCIPLLKYKYTLDL